MRLSLCVICGNETAHIEQMLESFGAMFDELSLVRAIGTQTPDDTATKAEDWCAKHGKSLVFSDYANAPAAQKWTHVDSFAAARNQAFRQATGDWLCWCDCDDTVQQAGEFKTMLDCTAPDILMVRCIYDVQGTGKRLFRERAIRSSAFHAGRVWHHDVHENLLLLPGDRHQDWVTPIWVHTPKEIKRENRKRNLKILGKSVSDAATQYFYIHQEHYCNQDRDAAEQFGRLAISFPNLENSFRYEALLNLAKIVNNHREATQFCLSAHGVFPWCREAIAAMILLHFEKNDSKRAAWWANVMLSLPEPKEHERPWTHERKWYGWAGDDLAARAFRLDGNLGKADALQLLCHNGVKPRISLLHATRGRSSRAVACRDLWLNAAKCPAQIEHIFAVDADDTESCSMSRQFNSAISNGKSCVAAWNMAASRANGDLLVQLSDDWIPCANWDEKLLSLVIGRDLATEEIVIAINDGHRKDDLLCMAILSRGRYKAQGNEVFSPEYESVFSDNEFSHRAFKDGIVVDAREKIKFEHVHPAFGKGRMDSTYEHNNQRKRYDTGKATFERRNPA